MTTSRPAPAVITSAPPWSVAIEMTWPSGADGPASIVPASPRIRSSPAPEPIVSAPAPPTMTSRPAPVVIASSPPSAGSSERMRSMSDGVGVVARQRAGALGRGPVDQAVVAEDDVGAVACVDRVAADAAEDHVVARAAGDAVGAADGGVGRGEQAERHRQAAEARSRGRGRQRHAVVAEDRVAAVAGGDRVRPSAAEHDVVARAGGDRVVAAGGRVRGLDAVDVGGVAVVAGQRAAVLGRDPVDEAVVADHDVVAGARADRVAADAAEDRRRRPCRW